MSASIVARLGQIDGRNETDRRSGVGGLLGISEILRLMGPRFENMLRSAAFVTVEQQGTLHSLLRLLTDSLYRDQVVPKIRDDVVRPLWEYEFRTWNTQHQMQAASSVTNKIMPFLTNRQLRAIVAGVWMETWRVTNRNLWVFPAFSKTQPVNENCREVAQWPISATYFEIGRGCSAKTLRGALRKTRHSRRPSGGPFGFPFLLVVG